MFFCFFLSSHPVTISSYTHLKTLVVSSPVCPAECSGEGWVVPWMHHRDARFGWTEGVDDAGKGNCRNSHSDCWLRPALWRNLDFECPQLLMFFNHHWFFFLQRKLKIEDETEYCTEDLLHTLLRCKVRDAFVSFYSPVYLNSGFCVYFPCVSNCGWTLWTRPIWPLDRFDPQTVFDSLDGEEMRRARTRSNPYEMIRGGIFLNRSVSPHRANN